MEPTFTKVKKEENSQINMPDEKIPVALLDALSQEQPDLNHIRSLLKNDQGSLLLASLPGNNIVFLKATQIIWGKINLQKPEIISLSQKIMEILLAHLFIHNKEKQFNLAIINALKFLPCVRNGQYGSIGEILRGFYGSYFLRYTANALKKIPESYESDVTSRLLWLVSTCEQIETTNQPVSILGQEEIVNVKHAALIRLAEDLSLECPTRSLHHLEPSQTYLMPQQYAMCIPHLQSLQRLMSLHYFSCLDNSFEIWNRIGTIEYYSVEFSKLVDPNSYIPKILDFYTPPVPAWINMITGYRLTYSPQTLLSLQVHLRRIHNVTMVEISNETESQTNQEISSNNTTKLNSQGFKAVINAHRIIGRLPNTMFFQASASKVPNTSTIPLAVELEKHVPIHALVNTILDYLFVIVGIGTEIETETETETETELKSAYFFLDIKKEIDFDKEPVLDTLVPKNLPRVGR